MSGRTIVIALFAAALGAACGEGKDAASRGSAGAKTTTPATTDSPAAEDRAPAAPAAAEPQAPRELVPLAADPGEHTGAHRWSARMGGLGHDSARGVAIDAQGNVALTGYVAPGADLGDGKPVEARKVAAFASKYGPDGQLLWATSFGGRGEDVGNSVTFDPAGNVVVVGLFTGEMEIGATRLVGQGSDDAFIAKFSPAGELLWARLLGGMDSDAAHDVAASASGDLFVTGSFRGKMKAGDEILTSQGSDDIFVLRLDSAGDLVWLKQFGDNRRDFGQRIAVDGRGDVVLLAQFTGEVSFGGDPLQPVGNQDLALVKLDASGEHIWSRRYGGAFNELGLGLAVDPAGNIAITGSFDNEIDFGGDRLRSRGESDVFVARFDPEGNHLWSKGFGSARDDIGHGIGVDRYGNIAVGGWFWHSVDFGGAPLQAAGQNKDAFLIKLSADGEPLWSRRFGDRDHDQVSNLAMNQDGLLAVTGIFRFTLELGGEPLESARKPDDRAPPGDVFVAVFGR